MSELKLKYISNQTHQINAINSVCDLFNGHKFLDGHTSSSFELKLIKQKSYNDHCYKNEIQIPYSKLLNNLHQVQNRNNLPQTQDLVDERLRDFTIEMETGTGKTYVYIRTIYELKKRYGLTKFIIVVPRKAIREGVKKSFDTMHDHFSELYDNEPVNYFVYDSSHIAPVREFATSNNIQIMIITIDSFNKEVLDDKMSNIFHRTNENTLDGYSPQKLVSSCRPIVIIDEPQSVDNTKKAKRAISLLNPLFVLRYSATHRQNLNMVYQLGPVEASEQNLVKSIIVDSVKAQENLNGSFVRLLSTSNKNGYSARLLIDVTNKKTRLQKRRIVKVKIGNDLYKKSNFNEDYVSGWVVNNIGTAKDDEFIQFDNDCYLSLGETVGDVDELLIKRAQIATTINNHLEKQLNVYSEGVKVLSLFFIDDVYKYRVYDKGEHNGIYAQIFEEEYLKAVNSDMWRKRYSSKNVPLLTDPSSLHEGYFARDGKGKFKNSSKTANSNADISTFELIMQQKETLLSFPDGKNRAKEVSFIFTHSALKEGWDNPNIFQICTLVQTKDILTKRQKIGRGLRLAVNQEGERCTNPQINELTITANESYKEFAESLQREFADSGYSFGFLNDESFKNIVIEVTNDGNKLLGVENSRNVFMFLKEHELIKNNGKVTKTLKSQAENHNLKLPKKYNFVYDEIVSIILENAKSVPIRNSADKVPIYPRDEILNNAQFKELWKRICKTTTYRADIDSEMLINKAIDKVNHMPRVNNIEVRSESVKLDIGNDGVIADEINAHSRRIKVDTSHTYDLPDPISRLADSTVLTRKTIREILLSSDRLDEFEIDPEVFLSQVGECINEAKIETLRHKGLYYLLLPKNEWYGYDILEHEFFGYEGDNGNIVQLTDENKSLYNHVVVDSDIERDYARKLQKLDEVKVFVKLPSTYIIDTPIGPYNPDWAFVEYDDENEQYKYWVAETKGRKQGKNSFDEDFKIICGYKHFDVVDEEVQYKIVPLKD